MVDDDVIRGLLDELRFDEAEKTAAESKADSALLAKISRRRAAAEAEALSLVDRIEAQKADGRLVELVEIADDDRSRSLLALLPGPDRREAEMHLDEAARWRAYKRKTSVRHLAEARTALDRLDVELARGLVNRIDGRFLSDEQLGERDRLLLDISARSMELESMNAAGRELIEEVGDPDSRSWWRRWFD